MSYRLFFADFGLLPLAAEGFQYVPNHRHKYDFAVNAMLLAAAAVLPVSLLPISDADDFNRLVAE